MLHFKFSVHERRYRPGVTVLNGRIYVMGGEEGWDRYHDTIEIYDPESDRWEVAGHMPSARSWLSCVGLRVSEFVTLERPRAPHVRIQTLPHGVDLTFR